MGIRKAVAYARFSSDNQRQESIDAQMRAIREYCDRSKLLLTGTYTDEAKSGTSDKRPQFLQMITDSKERKFDIVIVHKLDRFSRDRYDSAFYKRELRKNNVQIHSVLENLDDSPESIILESVITGMAEYYSKNLAREVMKGMRETAYQCKHTGGRPPFGYKVNPDTKKYEIEESEAGGVRLIFKSVLEGKGYKPIIQELNVRGYTTRNGLSFGKNSIHEILRNEKYKGVYIFNRASQKDINGMRNNHQVKSDKEVIRVKGGMPAIVSEDVFNGVAAIISSRKHMSDCSQAKERYLLTGKVYCGECGMKYGGARKFSGRNKTLYVTYRCYNRDRTADTACQNSEIQRDQLEKYVLSEISKIVFSDDDASKWLKKYREYAAKHDVNTQSRIEDMKRESERIEGQIENIALSIADRASTSRSLVDMIEKLESQKGEVDKQISEAEKLSKVVDVTEEDIRYHYAKARELFNSGELPEIRQLINLYLDRVVVYREHVEVILRVLPIFCIRDVELTNIENGTMQISAFGRS
ncbi:MAG: recombinase family protein [Clostridia bacterium]|jgi:site-specific DNA recombinase|nr:recombinase family protein [Clostridia bacterium]